jgi:hypothetical protein
VIAKTVAKLALNSLMKGTIRTQAQLDKAESVKYPLKKLSYPDAAIYNKRVRVIELNIELNNWLKKHNLYATGHFQKRTAA